MHAPLCFQNEKVGKEEVMGCFAFESLISLWRGERERETRDKTRQDNGQSGQKRSVYSLLLSVSTTYLMNPPPIPMQPTDELA